MRALALALAALAITCVLVEVTLRTTHWFNARVAWTEPDHTIGWRFTPGCEYWYFEENDHAITGRINAMGWRDHERQREKPSGVYRVAVLGDSFLEAFQVELDSTFLSIAERWLNPRRPANVPGRRYELMNFGRSGMTQAEELIVLEQDALPCHPDRVLLLFTPHNDVADIYPATAAEPNRPFFGAAPNDSLVLDTSFCQRRNFRIRERINPLKQRSALVSLIIERYNVWRRTRRAERTGGTPESGLTHAHRLCTSSPDSVFTSNYSLCKTLIARMARTTLAHGARFELASVPLVYEDEEVRRLREVDPSFDPLFFDRDLAALADSSGFTFIPLTAAFASRARETGHRLHWQHWNYEGHRGAAEVLFPRPGSPAPDSPTND